MTEIDRLHTACKDCIFAEYNEGRKSQFGCRCHRIKVKDDEAIHVDSNIKVVHAFDNEQDFFVLNGIKCHYKRNKSWGEKVDKDKWLERVDAENRMKYQAIVIADDDFESLTQTIESLLEQEIKPQHISVVRSITNMIRPSVIHDYLTAIDLPWKIENSMDKDLQYSYNIDNIIRQCAYPYYCILYSGQTLPLDFFTVLNDKIYQEHVRFAIIVNGDELPLVTSTSIHGFYGGHNPTSLQQKLQNDKCESLILNIQQIYPHYHNQLSP